MVRSTQLAKPLAVFANESSFPGMPSRMTGDIPMNLQFPQTTDPSPGSYDSDLPDNLTALETTVGVSADSP